MAKFDLNDSGVVVIVGSGAGGGTLGNELAQKGVKVVILEAGSRIEMQDFVNDEWESFTQLAWSDMRTTSGSWRVAKDFANLPAWIVKAVGGSTTHWAGASLRFDEHTSSRTRHLRQHPRRQSAGLADHARRDGAVVRQGRGQDGRHPHQRHSGAARQQQFQGSGSRREEARLQGPCTPATWRSTASPRRARRLPADRLLLPGLQVGAKWSTLYTEIPRGEATGNLEVRPNSMVIKIEHDASGKVTGVVYADQSGAMQRQKARVVAVAGNSIESPRLLLNSASTMFPTALPTRPARSAATTCGT